MKVYLFTCNPTDEKFDPSKYEKAPTQTTVITVRFSAKQRAECRGKLWADPKSEFDYEW